MFVGKCVVLVNVFMPKLECVFMNILVFFYQLAFFTQRRGWPGSTAVVTFSPNGRTGDLYINGSGKYKGS